MELVTSIPPGGVLRRALVVLLAALAPQLTRAQDLAITELLAASGGGLRDEDGDDVDWLEVQNLGAVAVDLAGWSLTDEPAQLRKWRFPALVLEPGDTVVVFASGKDRAEAGHELHTNFELAADGEFLALVRPDGVTIASSFAPAYPRQREGVSYGPSQAASRAVLIAEGAAARFHVPASGALGSSWTAVGFDDASWTAARVPLGYDTEDDGTPPGEVVNLAPQGTASQSTTGYEGTPERAIDGNTNGDYGAGSVSHTGDADPLPSWEVDLGAVHELVRVVVWNRTDCCSGRLSNFRVSVFADAEEESFAADLFTDGVGFPGPGAGFEIPLPAGTPGRRVRVELLGPNVDGELYLSLAEVEVHGALEASEPNNIARGKIASQSSTGFAGFASRAVDGDTDGVYGNSSVTHTSPTDPAPWWRVDLGAAHSLERAVLWNRVDCCAARLSNFRVELLDEAQAVVGASEHFTDRGSPATQDYTVTFPPGSVARHVRIAKIGPDAGGENVISLAEVQVFDAPAGYRRLLRTDVEAGMHGANASAYVRIPSTAVDPQGFDILRLRMRYDDGFVAYLNGVEVARRLAPEALAWNAAAASEHPDDAAIRLETIDISTHLGALRPGANVLAIHALNSAAADADFLLGPELEAISLEAGEPRYFDRPTPGGINADEGYLGLVADTKFSADRGFFAAPFDVELTTETPGAAIRYTTDSTAPTLAAGTAYTGPIRIERTTALRAAAFKDGYLPTDADAHTYIFPAQVIRQNGAGFPASWGGTPADYGMDPNVVDAAAYRDTIADDISTRIPTLSLVLDPRDLFGPQGIYTNPEGRGDAWEKPCSMELIYPDLERDGLHVSCGVRVFGFGWRSHSATLKHALRLMFKRKYGPAKLRYRFFPDFPVERFDSLVLRAQGSRGWNDFRTSIEQTCYIRDAWARYTEQAMGKLGTSSTYVHLYLNGLYWGLYNPVERPDAEFMAEHLGGSDADYDALNARVGAIEVIDGSRAAWDQLIALARSNAATTLEGYREIEEALDVPNLADYMLINFYTGNQDWVGSNGNNMRVAGRPSVTGFKAFCWDMEYSIWNAADNVLGVLTQYDTPAALHARLRLNAEYKLAFADRVQRHFFHDGALTPEACRQRWLDRAGEIDRAVVGESARWGDRRREPPYTRNVEWVRERERLLNSYFPQRTGVLLTQLKQAGLYPQLAPPAFSQHGGEVAPGFLLAMTAPAGEIFYTLDGTDPRLPGGALAPTAVRYAAPVPIAASGEVRARARDGATWSALETAVFTLPLPALRVTEVHYHPADLPNDQGWNGDDFEFLELLNAGQGAIDLRGIRVAGGVSFDFASGSVPTLAPGAIVLLVENEAAFRLRYGQVPAPIAGEYAGELANAGEELRLEGDFGQTILSFAYDDDWHPETDGSGRSLEIVDPRGPAAAWSLAAGWRPSREDGGTPGSDGSIEPPAGLQLPGDANQDARLDISDAVVLLGHLFLGSPATLPCGDGTLSSVGNRILLDSNGDVRVDLADAISLLSFLFQGGGPPSLGTECVAMEGCPIGCR